MLYRWKVNALKTRYGQAVARRLPASRRRRTWTATEFLAQVCRPGRSFVDVGGMWAIHGAHAFQAETLGCAPVTLVDLYGTDEFRAAHDRRRSAVRLLVGDVTAPGVADQVGRADVVWCFGVLYHHPNPHQLVATLRSICSDRLVLETLTIPEVGGVANAAVYLPHLPASGRRLWDTSGHGGAARQLGMSAAFAPDEGFANNFWALSPSAVTALLASVGFTVDGVSPSPSGPLRHVFTAAAS